MNVPADQTSGFPPRPAGHGFDASIEIDAPPEQVWAVLADIDSWPNWNPIYPEVSGMPVQGSELALTVALPGAKPQKTRAKVSCVVDGCAIHFGAVVMLGMLKAVRFVEVHPIDNGRTLVINGEVFSRLFGPLLAKFAGQAIEHSMNKQNAGLKQAVEARTVATE